MWLTFFIIGSTIVIYALDRFSIEMTAVASLIALFVFFSLFPFKLPETGLPLSVDAFLSGFANPALLTVLALLMVGQGLFLTGALERPAQLLSRLGGRRANFSILILIIVAGIISAFLNNTPVVVMFLPIITSLAAARGLSASKVLMPLSFISILGGMTTLIGSSTNLLVSGVAVANGLPALDFFAFTIPGGILAAAGAFYVLFIMPHLLRRRETMAQEIAATTGKQFIAQIHVSYGHQLVGTSPVAGMFKDLKDMTVQLIMRGEKTFLPPFEDLVVQPGDTIIVAATRNVITKALSEKDSLLTASACGEPMGEDSTLDHQDGSFVMAEAVIAPGSRLIGRTPSEAGLRTQTDCVVLGLQRRSQMPRMPFTEIRLEAGDVLLIGGESASIKGLRPSRDLIAYEWSASEIPFRRAAPRALAIFALMISCVAFGLTTPAVAAITAAFGMIVTGCLNIRQAARSFDRRIYLLVATSLGLAKALEVTGGAETIALGVVGFFNGADTTLMLSAMFLVVALLTNVLSNNATAVLFTPIAISSAQKLGLPVEPFIVTVILAANCSFVTPIGYQTNLLVMGPGHYRFSDFIRAGLPLLFLLWGVFTLAIPAYYGL